jgi:hypothetical protein
VPPADDRAEPHEHLATMLAEMDGRLEMLQQELESLAPSLAPRSAEQPGADADPPSLCAARINEQIVPDEAHSAQADAPQPERPTRGPRTRMPAPRPARPTDRPAWPSSTRGRDDPPTGLRTRPTRQLMAVEGMRSAPVANEDAARRGPALVGQSGALDPVVRQTILEADQEAQQVVKQARNRIAEIAARTRALLGLSPSVPADTTKAVPPTVSRALRTTSSEAPERREYEGAVTVEVGPFDDIVQLNAFKDALSSVPGVEDVYIRTFERHHAHFELRVVERRLLIAELRTRARRSLRVIEAGDHDIRLEIGPDETRRPASR